MYPQLGSTLRDLLLCRPLSYPRACLSATLYVVNMLMISQDATRGGRLVGAVVLLGPAWVAIIYAGLLVGDAMRDAGWLYLFLFATYLFDKHVCGLWARRGMQPSRSGGLRVAPAKRSHEVNAKVDAALMCGRMWRS